ncbi:putative peptidase S59, nucleoporin, nucleoporin peptidase S59 [Helianthus annuus]|nr:putative peptidase S59, nucleoporin, nucleoporin peptidase S59 [Helianthus annuus]
MPAYEAKSHEELRCEDYNFPGKDGFGLSSSALKWTSPAASFPTASPGTSSIFSTPTKRNPFEKTSPPVCTGMATWKYPGPTFTSQPLQFPPSATTCLTTASRTNVMSPASTTFREATFNPFSPGTALTSAASTASSVSLAPLNHNPFTKLFTSLSTHTSSSSPTFPAFTRVVDSTPSSINAFLPTPAANSLSVSSVSSGLSPAQNCNGKTGIVGQSSVSQTSSSRVTSMENPSPAASPFGTLPPKPHMFVDGSQCKQPTQYGISSLRVKDKPAPVKYSMLTTRHLSGRIKLPVRKYGPKSNAPKVPYFSDTEEILIAAYVPRENPRALVVYDITEEKQLYTTILDVQEKLQQPDYYTHPQISELEAKERADPGFCRHVKDFVVGRYGYGSIKFLGETDVRKVDIETVVQFNNREVIVYMDDSKKPPVGEGLNKAAEITLLNIKCFDKKTGMQHMDGSKISKYTEMLKKKATAQGAEFMSYDPVEGEWKFRVQHF